MVKNLIIGVLLVSFLCFEAWAGEESLVLVKEGHPVSTIVIPTGAGIWTKKAAQWLQEYVRMASGAELKIVPEDEAPAGTLISVGHTQLAAREDIVTDYMYDGCTLFVKGKILYLIGRDDVKVIQNPSVGAHGSCRAVLTFLEDFCGVRWFLPGPKGVVVPAKGTISVPGTLKKVFLPAFAAATARYPYGEGTPASIINNFRVTIEKLQAGEMYYTMLPTGTYFEKHPEYFALIDGKRTGEGNHLCSTNPEVRKILLEGIKKQFEDGYDIATLGQEDGYLRCQCPDCEKMDNYRDWGPVGGETWEDFYNRLRENPCERVLILHKWIIDECLKSYPDKMINLLVYGPTLYPSKKIDGFGDHVMATICSEDPRVPEAWRGKMKCLSGYCYWFDMTLPMGMDVHATPQEVAEGIRYLRDTGYIAIAHFAEANWGFQGPLFYEFGKLLGNPDLEYAPLVEEYCHGVYGRAGDTMLSFFNLLYSRHGIWPLNKGHFGKLPPRWMSSSDIYLALYTPDCLQKLEQLLKKAEREADTEQSKGWLRLTRDHFDYTKLLTYTLISYREYQADGSEKNRQKLKKQVEAFNAYRMKIISYPKEYTDLWFPGHDKFCNYLTSEGKSEQEIYYVPWENRKDKYLKNGVKGIAIGYQCGYNERAITKPFTLDF